MKHTVSLVPSTSPIQLLSNFRSTERSYELGVLTEDTYEYNKKRSIISLKMCIMTMMYEFICSLFVVISPVLKYKYGWPNTSFTDPVCMFVIIPFLQLMNDDDTKDIIFDENWFQAVKFILGIYVPPSVEQIKNRPKRQNARNEAFDLIEGRDINHPLAVSRRHDRLPTNSLSTQRLDRLKLRSSTSLPNITSAFRLSSVKQKDLKRSNSYSSKFSKPIKTQSSIEGTTTQLHLKMVFSKHFKQREIPKSANKY